MSAPIPIDALSPRLREIADLVGLEDCLAIASEFGGGYLNFRTTNQQLPPNHPLLGIVSPEAAAKLLEMYAGERLQIPTAYGYRVALTHQQILADLQKGDAPALIAKRYKLSLRSIQSLKQNASKELMQPCT
jgi:Mor transcription activator family